MLTTETQLQIRTIICRESGLRTFRHALRSAHHLNSSTPSAASNEAPPVRQLLQGRRRAAVSCSHLPPDRCLDCELHSLAKANARGPCDPFAWTQPRLCTRRTQGSQLRASGAARCGVHVRDRLAIPSSPATAGASATALGAVTATLCNHNTGEGGRAPNGPSMHRIARVSPSLTVRCGMLPLPFQYTACGH